MVNNTSEKEIVRIAKRHFMEYGFAGARMQSIADDAKVNKALLHYYYKNKEGLFKKVFDEEGAKMIASAGKIIESDLPIFEKLRALIENDIEHLLKHPDLPLFMMRELARDPKLMEQFESKKESDILFKKLYQELHIAQKKGLIHKDITIQDIFLNMTSLTMFPFLSGPFCSNAFNIKGSEYKKWLQERKTTLPTFIIHAIKK